MDTRSVLFLFPEHTHAHTHLHSCSKIIAQAATIWSSGKSDVPAFVSVSKCTISAVVVIKFVLLPVFSCIS